jgi:N-acetyl-gamma-glutamyl-phosphate reductase
MLSEGVAVIKAGIIGATGYTGYELVGILTRHQEVSIRFAASRSHAGQNLSDLYPGGPDVPLIKPEVAPLEEVDVVFLCLPHGAAAPTAVSALEAGARVIDLSADFRLKEAVTYKEWYGLEHPAPWLLAEAVYGLTEFCREKLPAARLVANPGCYPTSILLALQPVFAAGAADVGPIIVDSKSGVSGAGRTPKQQTHFVEVANNLSPYNIGRVHRHLPEIEQELTFWGSSPLSVIFSPHLLPVPRGLLSTIYVPLAEGWTEDALRSRYDECYRTEKFVHVLDPGSQATLAHVNFSNNCYIGMTVADGILILTSAIDNLVKGAAGQAVQNMNVMFGCQESSGLIS